MSASLWTLEWSLNPCYNVPQSTYSCNCVSAYGKQVASLNCLFILPYLYYIVNLLVYLFICQLMSASLSAVRCPALVHC